MTIPEAAELLGLAPSTVRWQIKNRRIKARKMGRTWYVTAEEVARYRAEVQRKDGAA